MKSRHICSQIESSLSPRAMARLVCVFLRARLENGIHTKIQSARLYAVSLSLTATTFFMTVKFISISWFYSNTDFEVKVLFDEEFKQKFCSKSKIMTYISLPSSREQNWEISGSSKFILELLEKFDKHWWVFCWLKIWITYFAKSSLESLNSHTWRIILLQLCVNFVVM